MELKFKIGQSSAEVNKIGRFLPDNKTNDSCLSDVVSNANLKLTYAKSRSGLKKLFKLA